MLVRCGNYYDDIAHHLVFCLFISCSLESRGGPRIGTGRRVPTAKGMIVLFPQV